MIASIQPFEYRILGTGLRKIIAEWQGRLLDQSEHIKIFADLRSIMRECWFCGASQNETNRGPVPEIRLALNYV